MPFGFGPAPAPQPAQGPARLTAYQPTLRDKTQAWIADHLPVGDNYSRQEFARQLVSGIGSPLTWSPVGAAFAADEGGRQIASGHPLQGIANVALAALPVPAAAKNVRALAQAAKEAPALERVAQAAASGVKPPIVAYHGSPHTFDAFDASKIGTGEGAQAYGHGLYFAENEKTAQAYRDNLTSKQLDDEWSDYAPSEAAAFRALRSADGDHEKALTDLHANLNQATREWEHAKQNAPHIAQNMEGQVWKYEDAIQHVRDGITPPGSMYQVGINAHPDHFLDWDKPLSEQHPAVVGALDKVGIRPGGVQERAQYLGALPDHLRPLAEEMLAAPSDSLTSGAYDPAWTRLLQGAPNVDHNAIHDIRRVSKQPEGWYASLADQPATGKDVYQSLRPDTRTYGPDSGASDVLAQAGIPGIKYLDEGSRTAGDGTRNYVVFDPANIDIMKRYGVAATALGGGALGAASMADQPQPAAQQQPSRFGF